MDMVRALDIRANTLNNVADLLELMANEGHLDQGAAKEATGHIDRAVQVLRRMQEGMEEKK